MDQKMVHVHGGESWETGRFHNFSQECFYKTFQLRELLAFLFKSQMVKMIVFHIKLTLKSVFQKMYCKCELRLLIIVFMKLVSVFNQICLDH